ncbi:ferritin [Oscillospiraceae bacterium WX1]
MLSPELFNQINDQINMELYSAYVYLDIHTFYADSNLNGFANWFYVQTQEELAHAMLFMKYLQNNGHRATFGDVNAPGLTYEDFRAPAQAAYEHELKVTASINSIYATAYEQKDFRTMQFLDWFIKEQNEEEKNTDEIIKKYDLFGSDARGLYMLDAELGARVFTPPSLVL